MQITQKAPLPWYRQFWPWYLMALPASAVLAGIVTIYIAVSNQDSLVVDDYYKEGLAINRKLTQQEMAQALGLSAKTRLDATTGRLAVLLVYGDGSSRQPSDDKVLKLSFVHATQAERDKVVFLSRREKNSFSTVLPGLEVGKWHVVLQPVNEAWRIESSIQYPQSSWIMAPNL